MCTKERRGLVMRWTKLFCGLLAVGIIGSVTCGAGFSRKDTKGKYLDLLFNGQKITRYMYDYDESNAQRSFDRLDSLEKRRG